MAYILYGHWLYIAARARALSLYLFCLFPWYSSVHPF